MAKKKMKLFEKIFLGTVALATAGALVMVPLQSYNEYQDYLAGLEKPDIGGTTPIKKPVLQKIEATLVEGVRYFANDMAEAKPEDFHVVAHYTVKDEDPYTEVLETDKYTVQTPSDFYEKGGDVSISFRGKTTSVSIELEPVVLEKIEVKVRPYTIRYAVGSTFDAAGMSVVAVYNDGSTKELSADEYTVDTETALTAADKSVSISYRDGDVEKSVLVEIGVSETFDNGAVESIMIVDKAIVNAGEHVTDAQMEVNAVYESGNRVPLTSEEYSINGASEEIEFGKQYKVEVVYGADTSKKATTDVIVRQTVQGEDGVIVGGGIKTETEYKVVDGVLTAMENDVTFAGSFSKSVLDGKEASLTISVTSATQTVSDITMRCSNSYNVYANGTDSSGGYMMKPLQINTILDLTVNGREVKIPTTVILKGCGPAEKYAPLYGVYYEFTFDDVQLDAGINDIKFNFKSSTTGAVNCWNESPSTMNIDYVSVDTAGSEVPDEYTITAIEIGEGFTPEYAQKFADVNVPIVATLDNGTRVLLDSSIVDVTISGGAEGDTCFKFGEYTVNASLKANPEITASKTYTVAEFYEFTILNADIVLENGRVYYVFSGKSIGYTADQLKFFDGATNYDFTVEFTDDEFVLKIDVTDIDSTTLNDGGYIYPHMKVDGSNYENGANNAGDVCGNGLTFTDGKSIAFGERKYTLVTKYSMPALFVEVYEAPTRATAIKIADTYVPRFGDALADIPVVAILDGKEVALLASEYTIEIVGNESETTLVAGSYTIKVSLNNTELSSEKAVEIFDPEQSLYKAERNDGFVSDKTLVKTFVFKGAGTETEGGHVPNASDKAPAGAIGGLDKATYYVKYTFTLSEATKVDFVFNVAGNAWDGKGNSGLDDMGKHVSVMLDGQVVNVNGIELPAGSGTTTEVWWNLKKVVLKDVELAAGTHTFYAECITAGAGLNVGSMELYAESGIMVTGADVVSEDDHVYYTFTFGVAGYTAEDFTIFDGSTVYTIASSSVEGNQLTLKIDVTDMAAGQIYPHLRLKGENYNNGSNKAGDILLAPAGYTAGKSVTFNGKSYTLTTAYDMPTLVIAAVA